MSFHLKQKRIAWVFEVGAKSPSQRRETLISNKFFMRVNSVSVFIYSLSSHFFFSLPRAFASGGRRFLKKNFERLLLEVNFLPEEKISFRSDFELVNRKYGLLMCNH